MDLYPFADEQILIDLAQTGMTLAQYAKDTPDRIAVFSKSGNRTFSELNIKANKLVRVWREAGIKSGDSVALLMSNRAEFVEVYKASIRSGIRLTPVNWHLSADEAAYVVNNCDAKVLISESRFVETATAAVAASKNLVLKLMLADGETSSQFINYTGALEKQEGSNIENPEYGRYMMYTSGTTGLPKGVWHKYRKPYTPVWSGVPVPMEPFTSTCLLSGPAYHAAPLKGMAEMLISGAPVIMMEKWDAEETLRLIQKHKITHTHMVATMFHRLVQLPMKVKQKYDISSMKFIQHGAAPCPVHIKHAMIEWFGPILYEYYGATEGGGGFRVNSLEWLKKPGTVGKRTDAYSSRVLDDRGNELPAGETGTIYMKGEDQGRFEYYKDPDKTASCFNGDYFTVGDMGYFDEDGYLFLTSRTADLIISGGVNIYPQEVDNEVMEHEAVHDACTIGIPNEEWGEEVRTVVQLKPGYGPSEDLSAQIISFTRSRLAHFKCPRSIAYIDALPRMPSGKILRRKVREPYWQGRSREI